MADIQTIGSRLSGEVTERNVSDTATLAPSRDGVSAAPRPLLGLLR